MIGLLRTRRSIRKFTDQKVAGEQLEVVKEAILRAPSSRSINPWEFVFVDDRALIQKLATCRPHGSSFLAGAPLAIVICADERKSDVWVEDASITAILAQLAAHSAGLGSCWVQVRKRRRNDEETTEAYIQELLGIPEGIRVEAIIAVGHPDEVKDPVPDSSLPRNKIMLNRYDADQAAAATEKPLCKPDGS